MKIAGFDDPRPRGTFVGKQITGPRLVAPDSACVPK
jgi:hypothetical protein